MKTLTVLILSSILLSGCGRDISSSTYSENSVGEASSTYQGTIINVRKVTVTGGDKLTDNMAGMGLGAITGGLAGGAFGKGYGQLAAAAGGAVAGGALGALAQKGLSEQQAFEYTVRLTNGEIKTVVQGLDNPLTVGQRVLVHISHSGRSRITPDTSGLSEVQPYPTPSTAVIVNQRR